MSRRATGASTASSSSSSYVDTSSHPGFVNLGNTCFLNSVLQATSATRSLKQLYHPDELLLDQPALDLIRGRKLELMQGLDGAVLPDSVLSSELIKQLSARSKSPVLQLADEEHGRILSRPVSRRTSSTVDPSLAATMLRQAGVREAGLVEESESPTVSSSRNSIEAKTTTYEPQSSDLPLNTTFRQVLEKTWKSEEKKAASGSKSSGKAKVPAINPKRLLNIMASKYDQYGEYGQQDGHELLRHLLDSLRMEELDVSIARKNSSSDTEADIFFVVV